MEIVLTVVGYVSMCGFIVLFLRFANERDAMMRAATAKWIEETTHS